MMILVSALVLAAAFGQLPCPGGSHVFPDQQLAGAAIATHVIGPGNAVLICGGLCLSTIGCTYWSKDSTQTCSLFTGSAPSPTSCSSCISGVIDVANYVDNAVWNSPGSLVATHASTSSPHACAVLCDEIRCSAWTITSGTCNLYSGAPITNPTPADYTPTPGATAGLGNLCPTAVYVVSGHTFDLRSMDHDVDYPLFVTVGSNTFDLYISPPGRNVTQPTEHQCPTGSPYLPTSVVQTTPICLRVAGAFTTASLLNPMNPSAGISLLSTGGDSFFCPPGDARAAQVNIICDTTVPVTNGPDPVAVPDPSAGCHGIVNWHHPAGCPLVASSPSRTRSITPISTPDPSGGLKPSKSREASKSAEKSREASKTPEKSPEAPRVKATMRSSTNQITCTQSATVTIQLNAAASSDVTVTFSFRGSAVQGTDYSTTNSGTVTLPAGTTSATFTVSGLLSAREGKNVQINVDSIAGAQLQGSRTVNINLHDC